MEKCSPAIRFPALAWIIQILGASCLAQVGLQTEIGLSSASGSNQAVVTVPGKYVFGVCDGSTMTGTQPFDAGVTTYYDLESDPDRKYNLTSNFGGMFSHKHYVTPAANGAEGPFYPTKGTLEVLEANPVRAIIKHTYHGKNYGNPKDSVPPFFKPLWHPDIMIENIYAVYAPDKVYMTYALVGVGDYCATTKLLYFLHGSTVKFDGGYQYDGGAWSVTQPWTFIKDTSDPFHKNVFHIAQPGSITHGNGTTVTHHPQNLFIAMYQSGGPHGDVANKFRGYRSSISVEPKEPVTNGTRTEWHAIFVGNKEMTCLDSALVHQDEYRGADVMVCMQGTLKGFNPQLGSYEMTATSSGVTVRAMLSRRWPTFDIHGWTGGEPMTITIGGAAKEHGTDYLAFVKGDTLILQIRGHLEAMEDVVINTGWPVGVATPQKSIQTKPMGLRTAGLANGCFLFSYWVPGLEPVRLGVWNTKGQLVKELATGVASPGHNQTRWDGTNAFGKQAAPGVYILGLTTGSESRSNRFTVRR